MRLVGALVAASLSCSIDEGQGGAVRDVIYGMNERPANASCHAWARPRDAAVTLTAALPNHSFTEPLHAVRRRLDGSDVGSYRWFVVEKIGRVTMVPDAGDSAIVVALDLTGQVNASFTETGLLGFAFDPMWEGAGPVYVNYVGGTSGGAHDCPPNRDGHRLCTFISRFFLRLAAGGASFEVGPEEILMRVQQPYDTHNGGTLVFGPDGSLYISLGDGGLAFDPHCNGQNLRAPHAKILRLDVSGAGPYRIPEANPFSSVTSRCNDHLYEIVGDSFTDNPDLRRDEPCPETFAWGFRNPWRFSIDQLTGTVWVGDVGQDLREEILRVVPGGNYGWNRLEGSVALPWWAACDSVETTGELLAPLVEYVHGPNGRAAVTGGLVYRGTDLPTLSGHYLFTDAGSGEIWNIANPYGQTETLFDPVALIDGSGFFVAMVEDERGEVYVIDIVGGPGQSLLLLTPTTPNGLDAPIKLSDTGCVDPSDPRQVASGLIPYDVNAALWSDGADKRRFFALPDGTTIHVREDGDWDLPVGSVALKEFRQGDRRIETRLLLRHVDGDWAGYTYVWNAAQDDAFLADGSLEVDLGQNIWTVPSPGECLSCHTRAAGRALGLETAQLNSLFIYPGNQRANQLSTLAHIGVFDADLPDAGALPQLPDPSGGGTLGERARAYLHANCSHCHRPAGGAIGAAMDLLYSTPFSLTGTCEVRPSQGGGGGEGMMILAPGDASHSLLVRRVESDQEDEMPPLGRNLVDTEHAALLRAWVDSLDDCAAGE
jgi:uncharacterized repeat protein (TIGR03806 family)